jgi:hypothetical protein
VALTIKNPNAISLIKEYAKRTGQTQVGAVEDALRQAIAQADAGGADSGWADIARNRVADSHRILAGLVEVPHNERARIDETLYDSAGLYR